MFNFLSYISPSWYYNLQGQNFERYWANFDLLDSEDKLLVEIPDCFSHNDTKMLDIAYQAWMKGIIVDDKKVLKIENIHPNIKDEYRFIKRHFNPIWSVFVLLMRIIELNNPLQEIKAFYSVLKTKRIDVFARINNRKNELKIFDSKLLAEAPKVSVIIPTLNRYQYLKEVLHDLEKQDYKNFEVLIVDQSEPFNKDFYNNFKLNLKVWYQQEKALWLARNTAIQKSESEFILLFDDDSRVESDWITNHMKCLDYFQAHISSGVSISAVGAEVPKTYSYYKWGDQIDTGNVMLKKEVFRKVGLFDRQFEKQRQGDGEFGLRAYLAGFKNISNPEAKRLHLKVSTGGLRQMGSWDGWRPKNFFAPRPVPSVLYLTRKYFGNRVAIYLIIKSVLPSITPYRFKGNKTLLIVGSILAIFLFPIILISVLRSWQLASNKLREGAIIPKLFS